MTKRIGIFVLLGLVLAAVLAGGYLFVKRLLNDRSAALAFQGRPAQRVVTSSQNGSRTVKTYTAEELEEARKKGTLPTGMPITPPTQHNAANDAVQRNLQTIQEINRINQMNQRMMEQQQRNNRQNKN